MTQTQPTPPATTRTLTDRIPSGAAARDPDVLYGTFANWVDTLGISLYDHQGDALISVLAGENAVITTPTGSGKSLIATGGHFAALAARGRSYYTAPIKALVNEKFFALCDIFGADLVGMVTGDASVNPDAPIVCCTAEILANIALREGARADVDLVIMDEFHFISDPDRGWAWQVPLSELPQAQFVIMSATLGDVTGLAEALTRSTGRLTSVIGDVTRPVPLVYSWALTPIHETLSDIVQGGQSPVYIVHPSQGAASEQAQSLMSVNLVSKDDRTAIVEALREGGGSRTGFKFAPGFGQTLAKLLRAGIGVHHAGMLPKYRRLVEQLAQQGLLKAICGTDTLGVGINVPIRTVLFTQLSKYDGRRQRLLKSREFHQIAGRAGRAGFDTVGYVVAQAPDHQVENERLLRKAGDDPRKLKSMHRKKPPEGFVNYTEASFQKLVESTPETLHPRMRITHAMLLNLLQRDQDTGDALVHIVDAAVADPGVRARLLRRAVAIGRSLLASGMVTRRPSPTPGGRRYDLSEELQDDFALNQPLSAFAIAAIELLDPDSESYPLDVISVIEATLEDPRAVLVQQQFKARGETVAELKEDGVDYEERMQILEDVSWPKPLADMLDAAYTTYATTHPWIVEHAVSPKSIVRDMIERAMTFAEFVAHYKVQRSEGLVLRYLSDAYRALRQTVPEYARTPEFEDLLEWLGQVVRMTDSSLIDEWEALTGESRDVVQRHATQEARPRPLTGNPRAFRVLVRNAMFRRVQLAADDDVDALAAMDAADPHRSFTRKDWDDALGQYWDEHDDIGLDSDARGPKLLVIEELTASGDHGRQWRVRQIIDDPEGNHDWSILATVDLDASDEAGELVLHVESFGRQDAS